MHHMRYQKGVTGLGWLVILALIAFFVLIALKVVPVYMKSFTVNSVLSDMEKEAEIRSRTPAEILDTLNKRLSINLIKDISRDEIYLESTRDAYILELDYEVRRDFLGNIDLVFHFQKSAEIPKQ